jgi:cytochrome d ubiquinol oxidase subunit I
VRFVVTALLAVDPVPWARAQMAFTLAFHIVLVPLGVAWAAMMLIANYRGVKYDDRDAMTLAQRWSKYLAVVFAVGAVSGTVLSFEFGLLWPKFMGRWGDAFGIPFAIEGLFFFAEAIFVAIYIFGWKRMSPRAHLWCGVPIVVAGIGGTVSVIAANAWMNEPAGFILDSAGRIVAVHPWSVIFNKAMPLEALHMVVAAYLVGGFLVASVYAAGMLRGRQDRYHRLGFLIPFTVAAIAAPVQLVVGDTLARWVQQHEPAKFAAMELIPETRGNVPETVFGWLHDDGRVTWGIHLPGIASFLAHPTGGTSAVLQGRDAFPADEQPTTAQANVVHLAWGVMVALGTLLTLLALWFAVAWLRRRDVPSSAWFLRIAAAAGVLSVIALEAGWTVTEVGRQPWIVRGFMRVEEGATDHAAVRTTFLVITVIYAVVGVTTVLVLRLMSKRWRGEGAVDDTDVPYGPRHREPVDVSSGGTR